MEIILILLISFLIFNAVMILSAIMDGDVVRNVKNEYGIILNPLKHCYIVYKKRFPGLQIEFEDLMIGFGCYIMQFFIRKEKKVRRTLDQILKEKYGKEK